MFVLQGSVLNRTEEIPARVLLDSGASNQYVSSRFVRNHKVPVGTADDEPHLVQVADGSYMEAGGVAAFTLTFGRFHSRIKAKVLDLPDYDIILGFDWLRTHNPDIDWRTMTIKVREEDGSLYELLPQSSLRYVQTHEVAYALRDQEIEVISASQAEKAIRNPQEACPPYILY